MRRRPGRLKNSPTLRRWNEILSLVVLCYIIPIMCIKMTSHSGSHFLFKQCRLD